MNHHDFEFEATLGNGRTVYIAGAAQVDMRCECCDKPHIESVELESVIDTATGLDVLVDDMLRDEIDEEVDHCVYNELDQ